MSDSNVESVAVRHLKCEGLLKGKMQPPVKQACSCQVIREALQKDIDVMEKSSPVDLVTETDQRVEQLIISSIKEKFPTHRCPGDGDSDPSPVVAHTESRLFVAVITTTLLLFGSFIGEESVAAGAPSVLTDNPTWIIDPIDGTTNFVHRY